MAIVGAGPVGLALAIELARIGLSVLVVDRRRPPGEDAGLRPQLLVARAGDLAHLRHLGLDLEDPRLVTWLATRCEADLRSGRAVRRDILAPRAALSRPSDLWALATQPPLALVPIGRLQQALLEVAVALGVDVRYGCDVTRLRRHARAVSLRCADGASTRAAMAIVATGAARALIPAQLGGTGNAFDPEQRLLGGLFAAGGDRGRWVRAEVPVSGFVEPARCTLLQTPAEGDGGTALLVAPRTTGPPTAEQLHHCFAVAARAHGLDGARFRVEPTVFTTRVSALARRFVAGDGRAPVIIAGDAAQTGHVFSGQTCFVNLALALGLADQLRRARATRADRELTRPALGEALARYDGLSDIGAAILAQASRRHFAVHAAGAWALAGVAARA